ncbi:hypothetical protein [Tranquillimonas alkanivorans]|uniref:hypothetical protein n=1 Tax=Tranquillimonas alkanivorans TaxID=441119 RepID=UPI001160B380|nr:hypothetical protein [Tranquillimonas alkanivorans]
MKWLWLSAAALVIGSCSVASTGHAESWFGDVGSLFRDGGEKAKPAKEPADPKELLGITATFGHIECSSEYPILVSIKNRSDVNFTNIRFLAYAHDDSFSRAECAESHDLKDRVVKAGETYRTCLSTLETRGVKFQGERVSNEALADAFELSVTQYANKYGMDAELELRPELRRMEREHWEEARSVDPRQPLGCWAAPENIPWYGKVINLEVFSGF